MKIKCKSCEGHGHKLIPSKVLDSKGEATYDSIECMLCNGTGLIDHYSEENTIPGFWKR